MSFVPDILTKHEFLLQSSLRAKTLNGTLVRRVPTTPALNAIRVAGKMEGGSRSLLMMASGLGLWVVKFQTNPQHNLLVITEYIATEIARQIGLSVPKSAFINVSQQALTEAQTHFSLSAKIHTAGLHFASRFVRSEKQHGCRFKSSEHLHLLANRNEAAGALLLDIWLGNEDHRQVVFSSRKGGTRFKAWWIDFGLCFGAGQWNSTDWRPRPCFAPYNFTHWWKRASTVERWMKAIENFSTENLMEIIGQIPSQVSHGKGKALEQLVARLEERQRTLRQLTSSAIQQAIR